MNQLLKGQWICPAVHECSRVVAFCKTFHAPQGAYAQLSITAYGIYEAELNGKRIGNFIFAPGWTNHTKRLQVQTYDISNLLQEENTLIVRVAQGWIASDLSPNKPAPHDDVPRALIADITLGTGSRQTLIPTDESWQWAPTAWQYAHIYHGETIDLNVQEHLWKPVKSASLPKDIFILQEGEEIREQEFLKPIALIHTPKGETVVDFGQNMTGYVNFSVRAKGDEKVRIRHAEVLDHEGNIYTDNLRSAKATMEITLKKGLNVLNKHFTFYGFRYIAIENWPEETVDLNAFTAVEVHSELKRTGHFECGVQDINQLYHNIIWSQKDNYLDVPTDCPQRDERLGWTGDAHAFIKAGTYNYDVHKFFIKWLRDMISEQYPNGSIPYFIPNTERYRDLRIVTISGAWADACCICPWQIYWSYADRELLQECYPMMKKWVDYMHDTGPEEFLWLNVDHFGDWLGLDAAEGSYKGSTSQDLIASAFFAHSTNLVIQAGRVLGEDVSHYEAVHKNIVHAYRNYFIRNGALISDTQTAHVLTLHFNLCSEAEKPALTARLCELIHAQHDHLTTGVIGTPYLLHVLSSNGHADLAYKLLLNRTFPSWLYSVKMGATTMWEHWDGLREDGSMWSADMNSFNHYAYGAVADWLFGVCAGIQPAAPGYQKVVIAPQADMRMGYVKASYEAPMGTIASHWQHFGSHVRYTVTIPEGCEATMVLGDKTYPLASGTHTFVENC